MTTDHETSGDHGDQLPLAGLGPVAGEVYLNTHTHYRAVVIRTEQKRLAWVHFREQGAEQVCTLFEFQAHHRLV